MLNGFFHHTSHTGGATNADRSTKANRFPICELMRGETFLRRVREIFTASDLPEETIQRLVNAYPQEKQMRRGAIDRARALNELIWVMRSQSDKEQNVLPMLDSDSIAREFTKDPRKYYLAITYMMAALKHPGYLVNAILLNPVIAENFVKKPEKIIWALREIEANCSQTAEKTTNMLFQNERLTSIFLAQPEKIAKLADAVGENLHTALECQLRMAPMSGETVPALLHETSIWALKVIREKSDGGSDEKPGAATVKALLENDYLAGKFVDTPVDFVNLAGAAGKYDSMVFGLYGPSAAEPGKIVLALEEIGKNCGKEPVKASMDALFQNEKVAVDFLNDPEKFVGISKTAGEGTHLILKLYRCAKNTNFVDDPGLMDALVKLTNLASKDSETMEIIFGNTLAKPIMLQSLKDDPEGFYRMIDAQCQKKGQ